MSPPTHGRATNAVVLATRRIGWAILVVVGVAVASWVMTAILPGDPVKAALGPQASPADVERARAAYGLDVPAPVRFVRYARRLVHTGGTAGEQGHESCGAIGPVHVDLGTSFTYRKPVIELIAKRLPASIELALAAMLVQILLGLSLGALAAARRGKRTDDAIVATSVVLGATPTFVVGLLLQYVLAYRLGWLPLDGSGASSGDTLRALALPALTLGFFGTALFVRLVRTELGRALGEPYVIAARARGASRLRAGAVHALRNAIAPIVQLGVLDLGALVGGAVVTERIFRWPGLGELAVVAIQNRDAQAIVGVTLVSAVGVVASTVVADVLGLWLDPRARERG
ncbi:MAG TPA: ABC transporter permease [Polyangiaceae bacterium]|jgi:peptide/nickel transport system permease protein|nr:ABC transporter permease [Polyangiaceae bacterium]